MFGSKKIVVSDELHEKLRVAATTLGVSVEEFATKALLDASDKVIMKKGSSKTMTKEEEEAVAKQLQGLGYID